MSRTIDQTLDKLEQTKQLTADGRSWLVAACDPFHDSDMSLAGYPDVMTASTVVQLVKQQMQITVPASITSGNNWDASVVLWPMLNQFTLNTSATVDPNTGIIQNMTQQTIYPLVGGLSVAAGPQGATLWPTLVSLGGTLPTAGATYTGINPSSYIRGNCRLIAAGFEVINTTNATSVQGQVTAWRQPNAETPTQLRANYATTPPTSVNICPSTQRFPPANIASAQLLFGTRSWAASEGGYSVLRQSTMDNAATVPMNRDRWFLGSDPYSGYSTYVWYNATPGANGDPTMTSRALDIAPPFDQSGLHFTGLSYTTTLTINVRWFIERMPGPQESDLVVLATPSSAYDPMALELYAKCMRDMPPAVMLKENPLGEWFKAALGQVSKYAPTIGSVVGNFVPGAAAIGSAVGRMASTAGRMAPAPPPPPHPQRLPQSMSNLAPAMQTLAQGLKRAHKNKKQKTQSHRRK